MGAGARGKREGLGKRGRNIHELLENRVWFGLLFNPCTGFSGYCHGNCQLSWADGCLI